MRIIAIILAALLLNIGSSFAEYDDIHLECKYAGLKSIFGTPKIFRIARDGYVYDGNTKMELNREGVIDSYMFGNAISLRREQARHFTVSPVVPGE